MVKDILDEFEDFKEGAEDDGIGLLEDDDLYNDVDITAKGFFDGEEDDESGEHEEGPVSKKSEKKSDVDDDDDEIEEIMIDRHKIINLNDYETTEIEDSKEDIEEIGDFEREDYWEEAKDGYEGLDLEEL